MNTTYILQREASFLANAKESFEKSSDLVDDASMAIEDAADQCEDEVIDRKMEALRKRLEERKTERNEIIQRKDQLVTHIRKATLLRQSMEEKLSSLRIQRMTLQDDVESTSTESYRVAVNLKKYMQLNAFNDVFYIWYNGPYATINGFRLGNMSSRPVEWTEINAALGQVVLAVATIAAKAHLEFTHFKLHPLGSFPRITKADDKRVVYNLFIEQSFSLFPKRNFNTAFQAFLTCLCELGDYIQQDDPTLCFPFPINVADGLINDCCLLMGGDDEMWSKAMKYLLSDVKWAIAWSAKHSGQWNQTDLK